MLEHTVEALQKLPEGDLVWVESADGTRLRCHVTHGAHGADRPTVILAHGILCSIPSLNLVGPVLARDGYRVITFDQRAHGSSTCGSEGTSTTAMAADYRAVLEHFDVRGGVLVGHSMGAYLAAMFCVEHPEVMRRRLDGMVLVSGHGGDVARGNWLTKTQVTFIKSGLDRWALKHPGIGQRLSRMLFGRAAPSPAFLEVSRRAALATASRPLVRILEDMLELDHYDRIAAIDLPTEVICGELDRTCPRWCSERLAKIQGARSTWLPDVGHMVIYEAPEAIVDAVKRLSKRLS
jgi:pimeloyl-ACP methyl ester carboxylesterase